MSVCGKLTLTGLLYVFPGPPQSLLVLAEQMLAERNAL